ncbi:MAG: hypothetical protein GXY83_17325 [Rhodopirellula sp.]|nr:hypothetical protein [Rhodopirellula sp.]
MSVAAQILAGILGAAAGMIAACFATYYTCVLIDRIRGATGGNGLLTIGWLFLVVTAPMGGLVGTVLLVMLTRNLMQ